ncbi:hypothetical protein ETAA8_59860 [Anatilimnocola aggregata]|uniref:Uncharacterized protein n=2 Tax=Anatilimnocola aggregata TaxID=2528021 RepID=A0A517YKT4_9BACT|nr:hypothetical protein ETAA8_59860 [Anatilimnocola aggregata]
MHLAMTDLFRAKWTNKIHEEWISNLLLNRDDLTRERLERTRDLMNQHVRDCLVEDFEHFEKDLELPDPNDRHVLAAAIKARADAIITINLKDFPDSTLSKYGIEAMHPDDFINSQIGLSSAAVCGAAKRQRESLKNPPKSVEEYLQTLEAQGLPQTIAALRYYAELI